LLTLPMLVTDQSSASLTCLLRCFSLRRTKAQNSHVAVSRINTLGAARAQKTSLCRARQQNFPSWFFHANQMSAARGVLEYEHKSRERCRIFPRNKFPFSFSPLSPLPRRTGVQILWQFCDLPWSDPDPNPDPTDPEYLDGSIFDSGMLQGVAHKQQEPRYAALARYLRSTERALLLPAPCGQG
jgi:hypothetical protein